VRTARYLLAENASGERELYDLDADPYQLQNQAANPGYDAVEAALANRLATLRGCSGAGCKAKPALRQRLPRSVRANGHSCRRPRQFLVRLRGTDASKAIEARFFVGSIHAARDRTAPIKRELRPRLLRGKRKPEISVLATLIDGRETTVRKRVRICR
jgi:hypothetical protein